MRAPTAPPLHGSLGTWDEVLLYCLPVVIAIVVLAITARRARQKDERIRRRTPFTNHGDTESTERD